MKATRYLIALPLLAVSLSSCGADRGDRALSGAGIGAGVGALGAGVAGGDPVTGAIVGGAVGAGTGYITKERDLNLGRPAWKR
jgi:hypothetical protein